MVPPLALQSSSVKILVKGVHTPLTSVLHTLLVVLSLQPVKTVIDKNTINKKTSLTFSISHSLIL